MTYKPPEDLKYKVVLPYRLSLPEELNDVGNSSVTTQWCLRMVGPRHVDWFRRYSSVKGIIYSFNKQSDAALFKLSFSHYL